MTRLFGVNFQQGQFYSVFAVYGGNYLMTGVSFQR